MKIAVASCTKIQQISPQPVWREILDEKPDAVLLLGDNVYLDHDHHTDPAALRNELNGFYQKQFSEPNFAALRADLKKRKAPMLAIYDDHDFLGNNRYGGDHDPALGRAARDEFVTWFKPPRTGEDVYSVTRFELVDVVILDERFYRTAPHISRSNREAVLGAKQWMWFENIVQTSKAPYLLVASSTTVHTWGDESWEDYPAAFSRLQTLIGNKRKGRFVVSGDVHRNAVYDDSGIVELVTSAAARNGLLFGGKRKNYGILTFDSKQLQVDLRSLKAGSRFKFKIPLSNWDIP